MTDRERLIGLIGGTHYGINTCSTIKVNFQRGFIEKIADHLLSNGVTFATDTNVGSKWIPVSERLPEPKLNVLVYGVIGCSETFSVCSGYTRGIDEGWFTWEGSKLISNVTHWMPLPSTEGLYEP